MIGCDRVMRDREMAGRGAALSTGAAGKTGEDRR
jgi:hypothetical protein